MKALIVGVFALLTAGTLQAQVIEPFAQVGDWQITTIKPHACMMQSSFAIKRNGDEQTLVIFYDTQLLGAVLGWATRKPELPPLTASIDFELSFTPRGKPKITSWGNQAFRIEKITGEYRYSHVFKGPDADRLFYDLSSSDTIALGLGPVAVMTLPLDAADAVTKLRECASAIAVSNPIERTH